MSQGISYREHVRHGVADGLDLGDQFVDAWLDVVEAQPLGSRFVLDPVVTDSK